MTVAKEYLGKQFVVKSNAIRWRKIGGRKRLTERVERPTDADGHLLDSPENPTIVTFKADDDVDVAVLLRNHAIAPYDAPKRAASPVTDG